MTIRSLTSSALSFSFSTRLLLLALALVLLLLPVGGSGALERAEVYFMTGARSMIERGDWLVPYYRGQPFFDKPALTYWMIAAAYGLCGVTAEAARVVPAVFAILSLVATFWLGHLLLDRNAALAGSVVLCATLPFLSFGRTAMADMPLTFFTTLALALGIRALRSGPTALLYSALGATLGLGFLAKGPIALVFPFLALLPFAWSRRGDMPRPTVGALLGAAACFLVIGMSWFAVIMLRLGWQPLEYFFLRENIERFSGSTFDLGRGPEYYALTYLAQGFPWSLFMPWALWRAFREKTDESRNARRLLAALALMALPLSLSRGKLDYYLLPLYPLASLVIGREFAQKTWQWPLKTMSRIMMSLIGVVLAASLFVPILLPVGWRPSSDACLGSMFAVGVGLWLAGNALKAAQDGSMLTALAVSVAILYGQLVYVWQPAFNAGQPNRAIFEDVVREHAADSRRQLVLCDDPTRVQRDFIFSSTVATVESCDMPRFTRTRDPYLMLVGDNGLATLAGLPIRRIQDYVYLSSRVFSLHSLRRPPAPEKLHLVANTVAPLWSTRRVSSDAEPGALLD